MLVTLLTEQASAKQALETAARTLVERGDALSVATSTRRTGDVRLLASEPVALAGPLSARHAFGTAFGRYWHGIGTACHDTGPERLA